ncbi:MAG: hypothetical protein L0287_12225, partial [Anaerolineae bacterium]|nr:hypothetical protein [Anaerolineae bacterium]
MAHFSEHANPLTVEYEIVEDTRNLPDMAEGFSDICVIRLPSLATPREFDSPLLKVDSEIAEAASKLGSNAVLVVIGEVIDLVRIETA